jgi:hypothetical protein
VCRCRARSPASVAATGPVRRAGRPAGGLAAVTGELGKDGRAGPVHVGGERASGRRRREVDGRDSASPRLRVRLLVPALRARARGAVTAKSGPTTVSASAISTSCSSKRSVSPLRASANLSVQRSAFYTRIPSLDLCITSLRMTVKRGLVFALRLRARRSFCISR